MKTIRLVEGIEYREDEPSESLDHHSLVCEIASRLSELDLIVQEKTLLPAGIRLVSRLSALARRSRRAYNLLLDVLSEQKSLSMSYHDLGAMSNHSRQSWLQNAQADVAIITEIWPEVGSVMSDLLKRRTQDAADL